MKKVDEIIRERKNKRVKKLVKKAGKMTRRQVIDAIRKI